MNIQFDKIPEVLRRLDQWTLWRYSSRTNKSGETKPTKVPKQPNGRNSKSNDPKTWSTFEAVKDAFLLGGFDGIGFFYSPEDPYCGVDLDGCRDPETGVLSAWAATILDDVESYAEISPSKTGVKIFGVGKPSFKEGKKELKHLPKVGGKSPGIEVYAGKKGRYFAMTGDRLNDEFAEPADVSWTLAHLAEKYWITPGDDEGASNDEQEGKPKKRGRKKKVKPPYDASKWRSSDKLRQFWTWMRIKSVGVAISEQGGHDKTFEVACLTQEFALDDQNARAALKQWNARCQPPWTDEELEHKLADAKAKTESIDENDRIIIGSKLGEVVPRSDERPIIVVDTDEARVNAEALKSLSSHHDVYTNGGELVHLVGGPDGSLRIASLKDGLLQEYLSATAYYITFRVTEEGIDEIPLHPPGWTVKALSQRGNYEGVRPLEGVVPHPVIRPDGTLATKNGYDKSTFLFISNSISINVPDHPTDADAEAAVALIYDVVEDFPFVDRPHFAAFLAGVITPLCRSAFNGVTPGFHVEGNSPGVGKGMLCDVGAVIRSGTPIGKASHTDEDEFRKFVTSAFRMGRREICIDNVTGKFGDGTLNRLMTADPWEDRTLGVNECYTYRNRMTLYSTGNNCLFDDDSTRRFNFIRLETKEERPEDRTGFKHPQLLRYIREHRGELLSAALTILRAYIVAGKPAQEMKPWGGFEEWSELVRGAVIFAGCADPALTRVELQNQAGSTRATAALFAAELYTMGKITYKVVGGEDRLKFPNGLTTSEIVGNLSDDLRSLLERCVKRGDVNSTTVGYWIRHFKNRTFGSYRICQSEGKGRTGARWMAQRVDGCDDGDDGDDVLTLSHGRTCNAGTTCEMFDAVISQPFRAEA